MTDLLTGFFVVGTQLSNLNFLIQNRDCLLQPRNWILPFVSQISTWSYYFILCFFTYIMILFLYNIILSLMVWRIQLWQLEQRIMACLAKRRASLARIHKITLMSRKILLYIAQINPLMGETFFLFLLFNYPSNCFLAVELALNKQSNLYYQIIMVTIAIHQLTGIILIHYLLAHFNCRMASLNQKISYLAARAHRSTRVGRNLGLNLFLQTTVTRSRYGITYGKFSLISHLSFLKVSHVSLRHILSFLFVSLGTHSLCTTAHVILQALGAQQLIATERGEFGKVSNKLGNQSNCKYIFYVNSRYI